MRQISIIFILGAYVLLTGCSDYNKVLKSDDYKRKFELANELYDDGNYARSIGLYEQIYQKSPKSGEGELSYFRIGKSYYYEGDFYMAGYFLGMFPQRFPISPKAEESLFLSAMCSVNNSPEYNLDQQETEIAINDLQQFIDRYPNSELVDSCNNIIDRLRFKIEKKSFENVELYSKTENFRAAVSSAVTFMADYPASDYLEEAEYLLVKNSYLLALNSTDDKKLERIEDTIERYRTFVSHFPESKKKRELKGYADSMMKMEEDLRSEQQ
jgi:outer membrane protein assembly factor BamD